MGMCHKDVYFTACRDSDGQKMSKTKGTSGLEVWSARGRRVSVYARASQRRDEMSCGTKSAWKATTDSRPDLAVLAFLHDEQGRLQPGRADDVRRVR